ncbi:hypothetical protein RIF29_28369 [Crotalaria pallida]|uniref:Uncharacterized protein n=1 Tax=Crotalaria pallida TaxID=3830 RepID=A0AAN9ERJ6_CROPI
MAKQTMNQSVLGFPEEDVIRLMRNKKKYRKFEWLKLKQLLSNHEQVYKQLILSYLYKFRCVTCVMPFVTSALLITLGTKTTSVGSNPSFFRRHIRYHHSPLPSFPQLVPLPSCQCCLTVIEYYTISK